VWEITKHSKISNSVVTSCRILSKILNLTEPQFPHLSNKASCIGLRVAVKMDVNRKIALKQVMQHKKLLVKPYNESRIKIKGPMRR
jgi:hypothetical protein